MDLDTFKNTLIPLRGKLIHYSQKLLGNEDDAEDVVQEAYLKLWNVRERLGEYRSVEALAMQVTKNLSIDKLRTGKINADEREIVELHTTIKTPFEQLEQSDAVNHIRMLIEKLPNLQQMIIRMKDIEGYELDEIAAITGTQLEAVRVNLSRARKKVREQFLAIYK
jgi:RNA polymerase sigma-70 factor (ECF subfamily)